MLFIRKILETGIMPAVESFNATVLGEREFARELLENFEKEPGPDFKFGQREYFETLLDQQIPLGPMEAIVRKARVSAEELEMLRQCATGKSRRKEIRLRLKGEIEVRFPKWPRQKEEDDAPVTLKESSSSAKRKRAKPARHAKKRAKAAPKRKGASR